MTVRKIGNQTERQVGGQKDRLDDRKTGWTTERQTKSKTVRHRERQMGQHTKITYFTAVMNESSKTLQ